MPPSVGSAIAEPLAEHPRQPKPPTSLATFPPLSCNSAAAPTTTAQASTPPPCACLSHSHDRPSHPFGCSPHGSTAASQLGSSPRQRSYHSCNSSSPILAVSPSISLYLDMAVCVCINSCMFLLCLRYHFSPLRGSPLISVVERECTHALHDEILYPSTSSAAHDASARASVGAPQVTPM